MRVENRAIEYSVDGGNTFLPIVYFIDGPDIVLSADGSVDAVKTLTNANADTAAWVDGGVAQGGKYGDGVGAPISAAGGHQRQRALDGIRQPG